jgi:5-oxoprolinase (ATP-hydrolysing) subunit A
MTLQIDLNADLGESFGPWTHGEDAMMLDIVTSANIACGFHAGDPDVMDQTMRLALARGVGLGAHPGFADLKGFGRRPLTLSHDEIANAVAYQLGAAQAMARRAGGRITHLKLHGALANMAAADVALARTCYRAALDVDADLVMLVMAASAQQTAAIDLDCHWAAEIFADRAYEDDASLRDRALAGAVLDDPAVVGPRVLAMLQSGAIISATGKHIPCQIDSICLHGDTPGAVAMARALVNHLTAAGVTMTPFGGRYLQK